MEEDGSTEMHVEFIDFDDLLSIIGQFGKYQKLVLSLLTFYPVFHNWIYLSFLIMVTVPDHWCKVPELGNLNLTQGDLFNLTVPYEISTETSEHSKCNMYDRNYTGWTEENVWECLIDPGSCNASTIKCRSGWSYDTSEYTSNYIIDFDIVCDQEWLQSAQLTAYAIGLLISCIVFGILADMYGRKTVFCYAHLFHVAFSFGWTFAPTLTSNLVFRFLSGLFDQLWFTAFTMGVEMVGVSARQYVGVHYIYCWNIAYMLLPLLGFLMPNWFHLRLFVTLASATLLISFFILPESPRWLYAANKHKQGEKITRKLAQVNGKTYPENTRVKVHAERTGRIWDLFSRKWIRNRFLNMAYQYFIMALTYFGLTIYMANMGGNVYLNLFLVAVVDLPATILSQLSLYYLPRRKPYTAGLALAGLTVLLIMAVPEGYSSVQLGLALFGKLCGLFAWSILGVICVEMFPTLLRKLGYNVSEVFCTIGIIVAPYITGLDKVSYYIPPAVIGSLGLIGAVISMFIPETKNTHLVDTLDLKMQTTPIKETAVVNGKPEKPDMENEEKEELHSVA